MPAIDLRGVACAASCAILSACASTPVPSRDGAIAPPAASPVLVSAIALCPMTISNPPSTDGKGAASASALSAVKGATLLRMPATGACLSSGYGPREGRLHRGVDYYSKSGGDVIAAGDGVIIDRATRDDYGNTIVIDHGGGVYTRYAHLQSFAKGATKGAKVRRGDLLGPIGSSGATSVRHLHFEVLTGSYVSGVGTFGLTSLNPFDLPPARSDARSDAAAAGPVAS